MIVESSTDENTRKTLVGDSPPRTTVRTTTSGSYTRTRLTNIYIYIYIYIEYELSVNITFRIVHLQRRCLVAQPVEPIANHLCQLWEATTE